MDLTKKIQQYTVLLLAAIALVCVDPTEDIHFLSIQKFAPTFQTEWVFKEKNAEIVLQEISTPKKLIASSFSLFYTAPKTIFDYSIPLVFSIQKKQTLSFTKSTHQIFSSFFATISTEVDLS